MRYSESSFDKIQVINIFNFVINGRIAQSVQIDAICPVRYALCVRIIVEARSALTWPWDDKKHKQCLHDQPRADRRTAGVGLATLHYYIVSSEPSQNILNP